MDPSAEKGVANVLIGAVVCVVLSLVLTLMLLPVGLKALTESHGLNLTAVVFIIIGPALFVLGLAMAVLGLGVGFRFAKSEQGERTVPHVQIRSRFAVNQIGEMIFSEFEYDAPGGELFIQVLFPDGHIEELKTSWAVFHQCGEGMHGSAIISGSWLSSFVPVIAPTALGSDPYERG